MERQITAYRIMDGQTSKQVGVDYKVASRAMARRRADRMDTEYGACRYYVHPVWSDAAD